MSDYVTKAEFALHAAAEEANQRITNDRLMEGNERMGRIEDRLDRHAEASAQRQTALIQSIHAYMEKQQEIEDAFLIKDGRRDYLGHRVEHSGSEEWRNTWRRRFDIIMTTVMVSATVGALAWVGTLMWKGFLAGPVAK